MTPAILSLAEKLITTGHRYLEGQRLAAYARTAGLSTDDARRACIIADRLRRHQQAQSGSNSLHIVAVALDAPIALQPAPRKSSR